MQYFKHQSNMRHDIKIKRVINKYGLEGYGLYNLIVESITESLSTDSPLPDLQENCEDIAEFYNGNTAKINEMMSYMVNQGLFDIDELSGHVLCNKVYKFLDTSQTRSEQLRDMIKNYKEVSRVKMLEIPDMSQDVSDSLRHNMTVSDFPERIEENKNRRETEDNRKETVDFSSKQPFQSYTGKENIKNSKNKFSELTKYWNEKVPKQATPFTSMNMSLSGDIITLLDNTDTDIIKDAIDHYGQAYEHNKYRVGGFSNFMTIKNVETWYPESSVDNRKGEEVKESTMTDEDRREIEEMKF